MKILSKTRGSQLSFQEVFNVVLEDLQLLNNILDDERLLVGDAGQKDIEALESIIDGVYERLSELEAAINQ